MLITMRPPIEAVPPSTRILWKRHHECDKTNYNPFLAVSSDRLAFTGVRLNVCNCLPYFSRANIVYTHKIHLWLVGSGCVRRRNSPEFHYSGIFLPFNGNTGRDIYSFGPHQYCTLCLSLTLHVHQPTIRGARAPLPSCWCVSFALKLFPAYLVHFM